MAFRKLILSRIRRRFLITFAVLYDWAFALKVIGTYGWFGGPQGPLAGVFLVPLGLPWILGLVVLPSAILPAAAIAAPALNLGLMWGLCRWRARR